MLRDPHRPEHLDTKPYNGLNVVCPRPTDTPGRHDLERNDHRATISCVGTG